MRSGSVAAGGKPNPVGTWYSVELIGADEVTVHGGGGRQIPVTADVPWGKGHVFGRAGGQPRGGGWPGSGVTRIGVFRDVNNNGKWDGPEGGDALYYFGLRGDRRLERRWHDQGGGISGGPVGAGLYRLISSTPVPRISESSISGLRRTSRWCPTGAMRAVRITPGCFATGCGTWM